MLFLIDFSIFRPPVGAVLPLCPVDTFALLLCCILLFVSQKYSMFDNLWFVVCVTFRLGGEYRTKSITHRRSQGCTCTPQGGENFFFRPNLQEKCVSAPPGHELHPLARARVNIRIVFAGFGSIFRQFLRATTKKGHQLFWQKSAPPDKILATPMQ